MYTWKLCIHNKKVKKASIHPRKEEVITLQVSLYMRGKTMMKNPPYYTRRFATQFSVDVLTLLNIMKSFVFQLNSRRGIQPEGSDKDFFFILLVKAMDFFLNVVYVLLPNFDYKPVFTELGAERLRNFSEELQYTRCQKMDETAQGYKCSGSGIQVTENRNIAIRLFAQLWMCS